MALWGSRFSKELDERVTDFTASVDVDKELYQYDIDGSIAHTEMLAETGIISDEDARLITQGLEKIRERIENGEFRFCNELEDIHMHVEQALIDEVGEVGAKIHSGRSRNDQIALDERMWLRDKLDKTIETIHELQKGLVANALQYADIIVPGFTHLQHAQPVLWSHHMLAYVEMFERDRQRLSDARKRTNLCPLGAGALAGSTLPLDRNLVAEKLGFDGVLQNSMDAVADRDYFVEGLSVLAMIAMHTSRLAEEMVLWASSEFGLVTFDDAFCTGSSLMPQKKNPDVAELTRGKTGKVYGALIELLTTMKALPLTYNRDLQEDKRGIAESFDTIHATLEILAGMMQSAELSEARAAELVEDPYLMATDVAEWLVRNGVPFRRAHQKVGSLVKYCGENNKALDQLRITELQELIPEAESEVLELFSARKSVEARNLTGGTASEQVQSQLARWKQALGVAETAEG